MLSLEAEDKKIWSVFQPIYSFANQSFMGVEVLARGQVVDTKEPLSVYECIYAGPEGGFALHTKQLNKVHISNWRTQQKSGWLFINLDFQLYRSVEDICITRLLKDLNIPGDRIVVEVVESEITNDGLFFDVISRLRKYGCLIALDDFGAGHSNIDRISSVKPDIVKLDRQVLLNSRNSELGEATLRNLVTLIKRSGCLVLMEGIETENQALLAMDVGVDLVQGFYFGVPERQCMDTSFGERKIQHIINEYSAFRSQKIASKLLKKRVYECMFKGFSGLENAESMEEEILAVSGLSNVKRAYILDMDGCQIDDAIYCEKGVPLKTVKGGRGLCWRTRRYFYKAVDNPSSVYVSQPYRSLIDVKLCVTVSKMVKLQTGEEYVVCFDLHFKD